MRRSFFLILSILAALATPPMLAIAGDPTYELITPIGTLSGKVTLSQYLNGIYVTIIGIAGILAVLMLVICGIKLMGSGEAQGKSEARQCITNAIFGLLLAIGSWVILNTINPQLVGNKAKIAISPPSSPSATQAMISNTTFVPNQKNDGFSCTASDTLGCVMTEFPTQQIAPESFSSDPTQVTAFGFSSPGSGAFKGIINASIADTTALGKLIILSEIAGDTNAFAKPPACVAQNNGASVIKYSMDNTSDPDEYCILKPNTRYYINIANIEKGTTNTICSDLTSCAFNFWTATEGTTLATRTIDSQNGNAGASESCLLRDPGFGLWSPDINAITPIYVVDQSTVNGRPATWTAVSGCVNGGSVDSTNEPCVVSGVYNGAFEGKTVSIKNTPGHILSIRYFVDHSKTLSTNAGGFNLKSLTGGAIGGAGVKMTLTPTPGDMNPDLPRCGTSGTINPTISIGTGALRCVIDVSRDIYYLNIKFNGDYTGGLYLDEGNSIFHPGAILLREGQCLSESNITAPAYSFATSSYTTKEESTSITLTVRRSGDLSKSTTVDYATANGTARSGTDYTVRSGTLTFLPGITTQNIIIPITNDSDTEQNEIFSVHLSSPSNGSSINTETASIRIDDDDTAALTDTKRDTTSPSVSILAPVTNSFTSATTLTIDLKATDNTDLREVLLTVTHKENNETILNTSSCTLATPCTTTFTNTHNINTLQEGNGTYLVKVKACDTKNNCTTKESSVRVCVNLNETDKRCASDLFILKSCVGQPISGSCSRADLNADGLISIADVTIFEQAEKYDFNKDGFINYKTTTTNFADEVCYLRTKQDNLFPCALRVYGNFSLSADEIEAMVDAYEDAMNLTTGSISLNSVKNGLCGSLGCTSEDSTGIAGTRQKTPAGEIMFSTLSAHDLNKDGYLNEEDDAFLDTCVEAPTTPNCARADLNMDGYVTSSDFNFSQHVLWSLGGTDMVSTNVMRMRDIERRVWDATLQPDLGILQVCKSSTIPLGLICSNADLDGTGVVNDTDNNLLTASAKNYDLNDDGVVVYAHAKIPSPLPASSAPAMPTNFTINTRITTSRDTIVRQDPGETERFIGYTLKNTKGTVIEGQPILADGEWWWKVKWDNKIIGWTVNDDLALSTGGTTPTSSYAADFCRDLRVKATANLNLRSSASITSNYVGSIPKNSVIGTIKSGSIYADGYYWWEVKWDNGITAWSTDKWMVGVNTNGWSTPYDFCHPWGRWSGWGDN